MAYPENYKYAKSHEWLAFDDTDPNTVLIGITDYAQNSLGDIVFVELPEEEQHIEAGKTFGSVESVKAVSDLYAPAGGIVTERNSEAISCCDIINTKADTTWLIKVSNFKLADGLLSAAEYEKYVAEETGH